MKRTFSSGTEYMVFVDTYCNSCRRHVDYDKSWESEEDGNETKANMCPIEIMMERARFDNELFPDNFVYQNGDNKFICSAYFEGMHPMMESVTMYDRIWRFDYSEGNKQ